MDCREFHKHLEQVMAGEPAGEALAHAAGCPVCQGVIEDLRLITHTSRQLALHEPPEQVWEAIRRQLEAEGLIHSQGWLERLLGGFGRFQPWAPTPALATVYVLVLLLGGALVVSQLRLPSTPNGTQQADNQASAVEKAAALNGYDVQLAQLEKGALQRIAASNPELHAAFAADLATVNDAIRTCHDTLQQDPDDRSARQQLYAAYEQKAVVLQSMLDPDLGM